MSHHQSSSTMTELFGGRRCKTSLETKTCFNSIYQKRSRPLIYWFDFFFFCWRPNFLCLHTCVLILFILDSPVKGCCFHCIFGKKYHVIWRKAELRYIYVNMIYYATEIQKVPDYTLSFMSFWFHYLSVDTKVPAFLVTVLYVSVTKVQLGFPIASLDNNQKSKPTLLVAVAFFFTVTALSEKCLMLSAHCPK